MQITIFLEAVKIINVVDGDTYDVKTDLKTLNLLLRNGIVEQKHVNVSRSTFRVRLTNVDTGESTHVDKSKNTEKGRNSTKFARAKYSNKESSFECYKKDYYGRAVCSINVNRFGDIGIDLINNGHTKYITKYGKHPTMHSSYRNARFKTLAINAGEKVQNFRNRNN